MKYRPKIITKHEWYCITATDHSCTSVVDEGKWSWWVPPYMVSECRRNSHATCRLTWFSVSNHFYAASVARHEWRLISWQRCVIERIFASQIRPRIAFVAINRPRWQHELFITLAVILCIRMKIMGFKISPYIYVGGSEPVLLIFVLE